MVGTLLGIKAEQKSSRVECRGWNVSESFCLLLLIQIINATFILDMAVVTNFSFIFILPQPKLKPHSST